MAEVFEVRYNCTDCNPSSGMLTFYADNSEQVTQDWLIKGANGEFIFWYWDAQYTKPVIVGEDVNTSYAVAVYNKTYVFGLYGKSQMDIKLKMSNGNYSPPQQQNAGTVYFTAHYNNDAHLYYDDQNGIRREVIPSALDCGTVSITECCFVKGTQVSMANYTTKNIEEIQKGDRVISYNIMTQEFYESEVRNLIINHNTTDLAIILFDDNSTLEMNAYHPLLTQDGFHSLTCYNNYKLLTESDSVKTLDGYKKIIKIQRLTCNSPMITYNLNTQDLNEIIDDDSNDTFIANNCVVHNAPCPT